MAYSRQELGLGVCVVFLAHAFGVAQQQAPAPSQGHGAIITGNPAPSSEQLSALVARAVENEHTNDRALEEFERVEHIVERKAANGEVLFDRTRLIVPFGTGTMKLPMAENGVPDPPADFRKQLEYAVSILERSVHPDEHSQDFIKYQKRQRDRSELVDAAGKAFRLTWAGYETRNGRTLVKLLLEPDPNFKPPTRLAVVFQHVHATLWVDEAQSQIARMEGDIISDVYFGAGIAGKISQGGRFVLEQDEAAPGVWLPTLLLYNLDGRRFMFPFGIHERTEVSRYRRIGPPAQALEFIRSELNSQASSAPAH